MGALTDSSRLSESTPPSRVGPRGRGPRRGARAARPVRSPTGAAPRGPDAPAAARRERETSLASHRIRAERRPGVGSPQNAHPQAPAGLGHRARRCGPCILTVRARGDLPQHTNPIESPGLPLSSPLRRHSGEKVGGTTGTPEARPGAVGRPASETRSIHSMTRGSTGSGSADAPRSCPGRTRWIKWQSRRSPVPPRSGAGVTRPPDIHRARAWWPWTAEARSLGRSWGRRPRGPCPRLQVPLFNTPRVAPVPNRSAFCFPCVVNVQSPWIAKRRVSEVSEAGGEVTPCKHLSSCESQGAA